MNVVKSEIAIMRELDSTERPKAKAGLYANITRRKCGDGVQKSVRKSDVLLILEVLEPTASGAERLLVRERTRDKEHIINSDRFEYSIYTAKEVQAVVDHTNRLYRETLKLAQEKRRLEELNREDKSTCEAIASKFTDNEHFRISYVHLVLAEMVMREYDNAHETLRMHKPDDADLKKLNREFNEVREYYTHELETHELTRNIAKVVYKNADVMERALKDKEPSTYYFINDRIEKMYREQYKGTDIPYLGLRVIGQLGLMQIEVYSREIDKVNAMIDARLGNQKRYDSMKNPLIVSKMKAYFEALISDYTLEDDGSIETMIKTWCRFVDESEVDVKN